MLRSKVESLIIMLVLLALMILFVRSCLTEVSLAIESGQPPQEVEAPILHGTLCIDIDTHDSMECYDLIVPADGRLYYERK